MCFAAGEHAVMASDCGSGLFAAHALPQRAQPQPSSIALTPEKTYAVQAGSTLLQLAGVAAVTCTTAVCAVHAALQEVLLSFVRAGPARETRLFAPGGQHAVVAGERGSRRCGGGVCAAHAPLQRVRPARRVRRRRHRAGRRLLAAEADGA